MTTIELLRRLERQGIQLEIMGWNFGFVPVGGQCYVGKGPGALRRALDWYFLTSRHVAKYKPDFSLSGPRLQMWKRIEANYPRRRVMVGL